MRRWWREGETFLEGDDEGKRNGEGLSHESGGSSVLGEGGGGDKDFLKGHEALMVVRGSSS